jgi:transcriptional regulator with XRE-family HTH domain
MKRSNFAENLIAIRKSKGISQRDLAKISGISNRMIAYYESHTVIPPIDKLEKLASALKVSIAELLDSNLSDKKFIKLNTRTLKKIELLEQLTMEDQRKVLDLIKSLVNKEKSKQLADSKK